VAVAARSARAAHALETRTAGTGGAGCHTAACVTQQHAVGARRRGGAAPCRQAPGLAGGPAHGRRGASAPGVQPGCSASTRHVRGAVREGHAPSGTSCAATSTHSNCTSTRRCFLGVRSRKADARAAVRQFGLTLRDGARPRLRTSASRYERKPPCAARAPRAPEHTAWWRTARRAARSRTSLGHADAGARAS
jgi:hypothetical protein